jgi:hypothetical protein
MMGADIGKQRMFAAAAHCHTLPRRFSEQPVVIAPLSTQWRMILFNLGEWRHGCGHGGSDGAPPLATQK